MRIRHVCILGTLLFLCSISCKTISPQTQAPQTDKTMHNKTKDFSSGDNTYIISAPISEKYFYTKNGVRTDKKEYYIQRSIQDYFIKFCESKVSKEDLQEAWDKEEGFMKALKLEVEFRKGEWDNCGNQEPAPQSRLGDYVVVHKIF